jgi:hypothetical protein
MDLGVGELYFKSSLVPWGWRTGAQGLSQMSKEANGKVASIAIGVDLAKATASFLTGFTTGEWADFGFDAADTAVDFGLARLGAPGAILGGPFSANEGTRGLARGLAPILVPLVQRTALGCSEAGLACLGN